MDKVKEFKKIVNQMADTYEKKNSNYGDSFGKLFEKLGAVAGLVPLYNKLHRVTSLTQGDKNHFESLEDTFIDMACYAIMNVIELRNSKAQECSSNECKEYFDVKDFFINDRYSPQSIHRDLYGHDMTAVDSESPCKECDRKLVIGACNGCRHNIMLTNTNGGTR